MPDNVLGIRKSAVNKANILSAHSHVPLVFPAALWCHHQQLWILRVHVLGARAGCHQQEPTTVSTKPSLPRKLLVWYFSYDLPCNFWDFKGKGCEPDFEMLVWPLCEFLSMNGRVVAQIEICYSFQNWQVLWFLEARTMFWARSLSRFHSTGQGLLCMHVGASQYRPGVPEFSIFPYNKSLSAHLSECWKSTFYRASECVLAPQVFLKAV